MSDTPMMTKEWIKASAVDPIYYDNALVDLWLDAVVEVFVSALEQNIIDLPEIIDSEILPRDFVEQWASTYGGAYSKLVSDPFLRQMLRSSMRVWKWRGSAISYKIIFSMFNWHVEIGEIWLDKPHEYGGLDLVEIVSGATWDAEDFWDEPARTWDDFTVRTYDIPAQYVAEFADCQIGKTTFYVLLLTDIAFTPEATITARVNQFKELVEPTHCRLLMVQPWNLINEPLFGQYGYWYGYGWYGSYPGYGYTPWTFNPEGSILELGDSLGFSEIEPPVEDTFDAGLLFDNGEYFDGGPGPEPPVAPTMDSGLLFDDGEFFD